MDILIKTEQISNNSNQILLYKKDNNLLLVRIVNNNKGIQIIPETFSFNKTTFNLINFIVDKYTQCFQEFQADENYSVKIDVERDWYSRTLSSDSKLHFPKSSEGENSGDSKLYFPKKDEGTDKGVYIKDVDTIYGKREMLGISDSGNIVLRVKGGKKLGFIMSYAYLDVIGVSRDGEGRLMYEGEVIPLYSSHLICAEEKSLTSDLIKTQLRIRNTLLKQQNEILKDKLQS